MKMLKLEIPPHTCKGCPYLTTKVVDHNYYGETSETPMCTIFCVAITNNIPCEQCLLNQEESLNQDDAIKYANFLVKEIEKMASETCNYTLRKVLEAAADKAIFREDVLVVDFTVLKDILDSLRED
jgi:hypothetical protein